jgi:cation diffusion facilitator CzcD-associated flavoprotein CzcO
MRPGNAPEIDGAGLAALDEIVRRDLGFLNYPPPGWIPETRHPDGRPVSDVVIVGGGMCGLVAAFALRRGGIDNFRILDRNTAGFEGPWETYARMETLRSPKQLLGPAYGMAALSFQAWYRAQFGTTAWEELFRIPRPMWMDYLRWYRRILDLPVENGVDVRLVAPDRARLLRLETSAGDILARRVILANGRDGLGGAVIPGFVEGLPRRCWAHSSDEIDFEALAGRRVVVVGVGASAVDNAATALEAGASEVRLIARRKAMPTINKLMGIGSYGLTVGWPTMPPEWRWRFMNYAERQQTPAPRNSTQRVSRHPNAFFHFGCAIAAMRETAEGVLITTTQGRTFVTDFVILGTGFEIDLAARPELGDGAREVALWADRYRPPPGEENAGLGRYPWLSDDFSFTEKTPGAAPFLTRIHCFNFGATLSLGKVSGDIPAVSEGALWLAQGLGAAFWNDDVEKHWAAVQAYSKPELLGDEWTDADAGAAARVI